MLYQTTCSTLFTVELKSVQSNLGYPNSFVLIILYCVRISEFVQITEVVAKISRNRLVQELITFQLHYKLDTET